MRPSSMRTARGPRRIMTAVAPPSEACEAPSEHDPVPLRRGIDTTRSAYAPPAGNSVIARVSRRPRRFSTGPAARLPPTWRGSASAGAHRFGPRLVVGRDRRTLRGRAPSGAPCWRLLGGALGGARPCRARRPLFRPVCPRSATFWRPCAGLSLFRWLSRSIPCTMRSTGTF